MTISLQILFLFFSLATMVFVVADDMSLVSATPLGVLLEDIRFGQKCVYSRADGIEKQMWIVRANGHRCTLRFFTFDHHLSSNVLLLFNNQLLFDDLNLLFSFFDIQSSLETITMWTRTEATNVAEMIDAGSRHYWKSGVSLE
jgi:hypothetical protein